MAPNQIAFKAGRMMHFISARSFALGNTGQNVPKGTDVMFDGTRAEVDGGEFVLPQLRGAIKAGWLVLAESYDESDRSAEMPVRAGVQVRHAAQGGNPMNPNRPPSHAMATTENDEREVGNTRTHAADTKSRNDGWRPGQQVNAGNPVLGQNGFEVVEEQDGVVVEGRTLNTPAGERSKQQRVTMSSDRVGTVLRQAAAAGVITPQPGITEEEMLERMPEEDQALYLAQKEALKAQYVDVNDEPRQVGRVKSRKQANTEGIKVTNSVGGGTEIADPSYGGKPKTGVIESEGMIFRTTNGPERDQQPVPHPHQASFQPPVVLKDGDMDIRRTVAKTLCPDFPDNYQFAMPDRKKIARLQADYEDRPDVIRAVFAAEGDAFKAKLVEEFPQAFGK